MFVLSLPQWLMAAMFKSSSEETGRTFDVSLATIMVYAILVVWVVLVSWASLRFMDNLGIRALGFSLHSNWWRESLYGLAISLAMITAIVALQAIAGGTRVGWNPFWLKESGVDWSAVAIVGKDLAMAASLIILAAAFEELVFRGYAFQTLLRGLPPTVPILLLSAYFGWGHLGNPNSTFFSTANTVLAGVWLSAAYLKTRSLWFPTALHVGWNWAMGAVFGLPVSGLLIPQHPFLFSTEGTSVWLTGGSYGPEGGATATAVVILSTIFIWRSKWLTVAPEMQTAWSEAAPATEAPIQLNLQNEDV